MPPTAKDLDMTTSSSQTPDTSIGSSGRQSADNTGKPQPVALEVPVTVNGARTVAGSDKREPFSEATQTVLVFGSGTVIRLASMVTPGQLLFLTNDKTKKEVVCQVLKSKNYSNVSGYVELEFTEAVPGFWGMRFPGDRPMVQPGAPAPGATGSSIAPPATAPKRPESQPLPPVRTETAAPSALKTEVKPLNLPPTVNSIPATALPKGPAVPNSIGSSVATTPRGPEIKPSATVVPKAPPAPAVPVNAQTSTDTLKRESARLQEQLSSTFLTPEVAAKPTPPASATPTVNSSASSDSAAKVIEMSKPQPPAAKAILPVKSAPVGMGSMLDVEEVKIPSWLEPLARNTATPSQNEVATKDDAARAADVLEFEVQDVSAPATAQEIAVVAPADPTMDMASLPEASAGVSIKNNKAIWMGAIAAGLLILAAGGTWYLRQSAAPAQEVTAASATASRNGGAAAVEPPAKNGATGVSASGATTASAAATPPALTASLVSPQSGTPTAQPLKNAPDKSTTAELLAYKKLAEPLPEPPAQPKKLGLGQFHLAPPAVNRRAATPVGDADLAPSLGAAQTSVPSDSLGEGLGTVSTKQPAAPATPLPVGGDVKQAHLISSTPPAYPLLAKSQHVEGNVHVDALVDANGHVSSMHVVSGPALLHQAAMDALRQWKYQPATLDGKPVPMHLAVTLQFRLQ
jgi:protein TonB